MQLNLFEIRNINEPVLKSNINMVITVYMFGLFLHNTKSSHEEFAFWNSLFNCSTHCVVCTENHGPVY